MRKTIVMKKIISLLIITLWCISTKTSAATQTFSDLNISFDYDNGVYGEIDYLTLSKDSFYIRIRPDYPESEVINATISSGRLTNDEFFYDFESPNWESVEYSEDKKERWITYNDSSLILYEKVLGTYNEQYITVNVYYDGIDGKEIPEYVNTFLNSIIVSDSFFEQGVFYTDKYLARSRIIYRNHIYSDQVAIYAQKAIEICDQYLRFEITNEEAWSELKEILKRAESYSDSSDNRYDKIIVYSISSKEFAFSFKRDYDILELKQELENILQSFN